MKSGRCRVASSTSEMCFQRITAKSPTTHLKNWSALDPPLPGLRRRYVRRFSPINPYADDIGFWTLRAPTFVQSALPDSELPDQGAKRGPMGNSRLTSGLKYKANRFVVGSRRIGTRPPKRTENALTSEVWKPDRADALSENRTSVSFRKEVIQPQVPLRLPCYDLVPVIGLTVGRRLLSVS